VEAVTEGQIAYLAGIIDGEGTIYWNKIGARGTIYLRVVQADRRLMDWLVAVTGCGTLHTRPEWGPFGQRQIWSWSVNATRAAYIVRRVQPHLIVKAEQAAAVLAKWDEAGASQPRPGRRVCSERRTADVMAARGW
jgi:hypothetical protein